jgi:hypothetical protein
MVSFISLLSVAQAATVINACITVIHFTTALSLVILLIYFMPKTNTAIAWSSISRTLQTSVWPAILRTDSSSKRVNGAMVSTISIAFTVTTGLVAIAGVILPLGLSDGPFVATNFRTIPAQYVPDNSALALATTPDREDFVYGRVCGSFEPAICPGNNNPNTTTINPSIVEIFNSTPHGPFNMQYRRFFDGDPVTQNCSVGIMGTAETFILLNDTFVAEGLVIDMSQDHPGIGFWNQTIPVLRNGATWSQDILWLEPVTQCVDTNLTIDYFMMDGPDNLINNFNLTDHGGFVNLSPDPPPPLDLDGQNIDLYQHAYKGAAWSDDYAMVFLNATRQSSSIGASYPLSGIPDISLSSSGLGNINVVPISYLNSSVLANASIICQGYGGQDTANITNVHVSCGVFLGPPLRIDGGDPRVFNRGSKWSQGVQACSSATRASVQTTTFSTNTTSDIQDLVITRAPTDIDVLWATEKTDLTLTDVDLFWGRVDDQYENDPSLWTIRADKFYLPAGSSSIWNAFPAGSPAAAHAHIWGQIYDPADTSGAFVTDYSGKSDYSIKAKMQSLVAQNPTIGNAQIRNLVWTDMMANNVIGSGGNDTVWAADNVKTIQYNFKYAIPGLLLLLIWLPSFLGGLYLLLTRAMTFGRMRTVLNHTSVGRVVVGTSALRTQAQGQGYMSMPQPSFPPSPSYVDPSSPGHHRNKSDWGRTAGSAQVTLDFDQLNHVRSTEDENLKLMPA